MKPCSEATRLDEMRRLVAFLSLPERWHYNALVLANGQTLAAPPGAVHRGVGFRGNTERTPRAIGRFFNHLGRLDEIAAVAEPVGPRRRPPTRDRPASAFAFDSESARTIAETHG